MMTQCCTWKPDWKRIAIALVAGFAFVFIFDMVVHGYLLTGLYMETESLWRDRAGMQAMFPVILISQFVIVFATVCLAAVGSNCKCRLTFAAALALLMATQMGGMVAYMPISWALAASWFAAVFIEMCALVALVFAILGKSACCEKSACCAKSDDVKTV